MSTLPRLHTATVDAIVGHAGRATLPFQRAHREEQYATAFWFNELVESTAEGEVVRQFLMTASEPARIDIAEFTLRANLCAPAMSAEKLIMIDFADEWIHLGNLGVAVMPTAGLHAHSVRKGWQWTTDEITDGIAAKHEDISGLAAQPIAAYLLGHDVDAGTGAREQAVVVGTVERTGSGMVSWVGELPEGCVGAPVFTTTPLSGDSFKLVCLGAVLPGDGHHPIATFDRIRAALRALAADLSSAPETATTAQRAEPRRRWWQRGS
jgi:hypothetical protein